MLNIIKGSFGTGKSHLVTERILDDLKNGKKVMLIVPEQQALDAEGMLNDAAILSKTPTWELEVLNFTRLANRVFRQLGGLCYNYIGKGARHIIMWRALSAVAPSLSVYRDVTRNDKNTISMMLSASDELTRCSVSSKMLLEAADQLRIDDNMPSLASKISDLALIISMYRSLLHEQYDDPADDLPRLNELLYDNNFFSGYNVYFDSFTDFTAAQLSIVYHILRQADSVTCTLNLPAHLSDYDSMYKTQLDTERKLVRFSNENNIAVNFEPITKAKRFANSEIELLSEKLWDFGSGASISDDIPSTISVVECKDVFEEAEACALEITKNIRNGGRYYENLVVVRDTSKYIGVIDAVFERHGIPFFIAQHCDLSQNPAIKLILSALNVISSNWRHSDVITYIKTGLTGIEENECDILEDYAATWQISGSRWYDGHEWEMNPDGYSDTFTKRGELILKVVNDAKIRLSEPLIRLGEKFSGYITVRDATIAIFDYITDVKLKEYLLSNNENGVQIWNLILDVLDELVTVSGEELVTADTYKDLLRVMFDESDIGRIPTSIDQVNIASAMTVRAKKCKHVYLLGVCDGEFPMSVSDDGVFNDSEKVALEGVGIFLSSKTDTRASDELYYFSRALCSPSHSATLIYHTSDISGKASKPSVAIERVRTLFPAINVKRFDDTDILQKIYTPEGSFEFCASERDTVYGKALSDVYKSMPEYRERIDSLARPFSDPKNTISPENANLLFGGDISLTQTRLESFANCEFSYYCKYILKLQEQKKAEFSQLDIGNFTHRVLENFMRAVQTSEGIRLDLSDEEAEKLADDIINEYIDRIIGYSEKKTSRILQLFRRLRRTTLLLIKNLRNEFSQSDFIPSFFELPITYSKDEGVRPLRIPLYDGTDAYVYGKVDRVDLYKKNGKVYVRVVDYKTGEKSFSLSDIELGLNMQMLLYLFAICQNPPKRLLDDAECTINDVLPAGVLYMSVKAPNITSNSYIDGESAVSSAEKSLSRDGILIDDIDVLRAMEKDLAGKYIPVSLKKDGSFGAYSKVESLEGFGNILSQIENTVKRLSSELKSGSANAVPLKQGKDSPCNYCQSKAICRRALK